MATPHIHTQFLYRTPTQLITRWRSIEDITTHHTPPVLD
jgi:hypothetical protein